MTAPNEDGLQAAAADLPARFLECRMGDHRWKRQGDPTDEGGGTYVIRWRCTGCGNRRYDRVTRTGTLYARWYRRPDGYDLTGFGHATRRKDTYRRVLLDRTVTD